MLSSKNKSVSRLNFKSYNFGNTNHITLSDFIRIQNSICPSNTEAEERQAYEERLRYLSRCKSKNWNDSIEKKKKMELEFAKQRFLKEEERRRKIDEEEQRYLEAKQGMILQNAKEQLFHQQDPVKSFDSKLMYCDLIKEREYQKQIIDRKKEINNIIEKQFFDMDRKRMEELKKKEIEKKELEDKKRKERMKMINDQIMESKLKMIQDYQEKIVEGQLMKMNMKNALEQEAKEKELRERKIKEQRDQIMEDNKRLLEEKEKLRQRELEEEKKIEEFARKKNIQLSNDRELEEERIKKEKNEKMKKDIEEYSEKARQKREEERRKNREEDIKFMEDYNLQMEKLKEEDDKEKEMRRLKARDLAEYQKLQFEEKRRLGLDDFYKKNRDVYQNLKRIENENDDFIKYAEHQIQKYQSEGKNIQPLLIELKKYKEKYCLQ